MKKCPNCDILWKDSDDHCERCGRELGEACRLAERSDDDEEPGPERGREALIWFLELLPGLASVRVILASLIMFALSGVGFALGLWLMAFGAVLTAFGAGGGSMILYWTAWSWLLYGAIASPTEALAELRSRHWFVLILVTAAPLGGAILAMKRMAESGGVG